MRRFTRLQRLAFVLLAALACHSRRYVSRPPMVGRSRHCGPVPRVIGSGDPWQIAIKTGDELEALADQFNDMAEGSRNLCRPGTEGRGRTHELQTRSGELAQSVGCERWVR
jgi:hypothetical protein